MAIRSITSDEMLAVKVEVKPAFTAGKPELMFDGPYERADSSRNYDVAPDGRFVMVRSDAVDAPQRFYVALNWLDELRLRATGTQ